MTIAWHTLRGDLAGHQIEAFYADQPTTEDLLTSIRMYLGQLQSALRVEDDQVKAAATNEVHRMFRACCANLSASEGPPIYSDTPPSADHT